VHDRPRLTRFAAGRHRASSSRARHLCGAVEIGERSFDDRPKENGKFPGREIANAIHVMWRGKFNRR